MEVHGLRPPALPPLAAKLGDEVTPLAVRLDLTVDPAQFEFSGEVEIDVDLRVPVDHIDLHGRNLRVASVLLRTASGPIKARWRQVSASGLARVELDRTVPVGRATLEIAFAADFADGPSGMFRGKVDGAWYSWTQFQSIDARTAFPAFDEPRFKTPYTTVVRTPPGLVAVSNGAELSRTREAGLDVHRFATTKPLPSYLVAVMTGPFVVLEGEAPPSPQRPRPLPMRIVSTPQNAGHLQFALDNSARMIALLEDYFNEPIPLAKLDQVTSPMLPGAMENDGAILYRDDLIVLDDDASVAQQREFARVVAHELAHQWFGNLVTPAWWDDLWLSESFANAMGYHIGDAWRPDLNLRSAALVEGFKAMDTDALLSGRPVREAIETDEGIDAAFDPITYGKGGQIVAMVSNYLGPGQFRAGVRRYIDRHRYGSATSDQLFAAIAEEADDPRIVGAARSFLGQQGVPLLVFRREGDRFRLSQQRYVPYGVEPRDDLWTIPMCARRAQARLCRMLISRNDQFELDGNGPIVPNARGAGYYRFELAERNWKALIRHAADLSGGEALALVDSLKASILAGRGTIGELALLARKLRDHPDSYAADAPDKAMSSLVTMGLVDATGRWGWRRFRQRLYLPLLKRYGFDPSAGAYAGEPAERSQRRVQVVAALLGTPGGGRLRDNLMAAVTAYLAGDKRALDETWLDHGLDLHLYFNGEAAARELVEKALASDDPVFRPEALAAASRTGDKDVSAWLLDLKDPRLRESERQEIVEGVMARSATRELGYAWILRHLDALLEGSSGVYYASRLPRALGHFCSRDWAERIAEEMRPRFALTSGATELERSIERVRNCGALDRELGAVISEEFRDLK
ncbi:aminopeptidase [Novosphingobium sp. PC22D]|nr:aminopeptidase [Novosphingobium sp. PC22D]